MSRGESLVRYAAMSEASTESGSFPTVSTAKQALETHVLGLQAWTGYAGLGVSSDRKSSTLWMSQQRGLGNYMLDRALTGSGDRPMLPDLEPRLVVERKSRGAVQVLSELFARLRFDAELRRRLGGP